VGDVNYKVAILTQIGLGNTSILGFVDREIMDSFKMAELLCPKFGLDA